MIRNALLTALLATAFMLPPTVLAQDGQPPVPTPGPDQIVFVGRVPAPAGTTVTLQVFHFATAEFTECDTATTFTGPDDSPDTSSFVLVLEAACSEGAAGALVCWTPGFGHCDGVAFDPSQHLPGSVQPGLADITELGQTVDTGLLTEPPTEPECTVVPPDLYEPPTIEELPAPSILLAAPTPGPDQVVLVGWVPAPPGTTVTLKAADPFSEAPAELTDCDTTTSRAGILGREDVSEFLLILDRSCLGERTIAAVCWSPRTSSDCEPVSARLPDLGQTIDTGLLRGVPTVPEGTCVLPPVGGRMETHQETRYGWLLWAGVAALAGGLLLGIASLAAARRR